MPAWLVYVLVLVLVCVAVGGCVAVVEAEERQFARTVGQAASRGTPWQACTLPRNRRHPTSVSRWEAQKGVRSVVRSVCLSAQLLSSSCDSGTDAANNADPISGFSIISLVACLSARSFEAGRCSLVDLRLELFSS